MSCEPRIFPRTRQSGHDGHFASGSLVSQIAGVAPWGSKVQKPTVVRGKLSGTVKAILLSTVFAEQFDLQQQIWLIVALPAQGVSLRQQGEQIAACRLAEQKSHALGIRPLDEM